MFLESQHNTHGSEDSVEQRSFSELNTIVIEMCWRSLEKINWTDRVRNEKVLAASVV
jgi:hypothetical protein